MAELLTGNPDAMISMGGMNPEVPCGYFRWSPCTFNNFNDWLGTLRARLRILERNWAKLNDQAATLGKKPLTTDEESIGPSIQTIKNFVLDMKETSADLHRDDYFARIAEIQSNLAETNALLELTQDGIEERGGRYITAGFARPKSSWGAWLIIGGLLVGGYYTSKYLYKKYNNKSVGSGYVPAQLGLGDVKIT